MGSSSRQILSRMGGRKVIFYYVILQGTWHCILFHFIFPSVGRLQVRRGWQDRCVQTHNPWSVAVCQQPPPATGSPTLAANHLSCVTHLKVTLRTWTVLKTFRSPNWFKAGFYSGTLSGGEGFFLISWYFIWFLYIFFYLNKTSHC